MSHAALIAVLMHLGGSVELPPDAMEPDALGGPDGAYHALMMEPLDGGRMRLSVHPRPPGDAGGVAVLPPDTPDR
ncbi:pRL2-19 [Streptomyces malaysiensis]|uniref:pRL2-19 n=1 Tax=Streptomyces malaysiensis TaxID=92644 RepID=UPI000BFCA7CD|nr:pRL2-19 [Streptomyces malaysiensis]